MKKGVIICIVLFITLFNIFIISSTIVSNNRLVQGNTLLNNSGFFYNNNKLLSRSVSTVICRGLNPSDDLYKLFTCDFVCLSSDIDCASTLSNCDGKTCKIMTGYYPISSQLNFNYPTKLEGDISYSSVLDFTLVSPTGYHAIIANEGLSLNFLNITSSTYEFNESCIGQTTCTNALINYANIKIKHSYPYISDVSNNIFTHIGFNIHNTDFVTGITRFNLNIYQNDFNYVPESAGLVRAEGINFYNNKISNSQDSGVSINSCGRNHNIYNNFFNQSYPVSSAIEATQDETCGLIENINVYGNEVIGFAAYAGAITFYGTGKNIKIYSNNVHDITTKDKAGIGFASYSDVDVFDNTIYNTGRNHGIYSPSDQETNTNINIHDNYINITNSSYYPIHLVNYLNMSDVKIHDNTIYSTGKGIRLFLTNLGRIMDNVNIKNNHIYSDSSCLEVVSVSGNTVRNITFVDNCLKNKQLTGLNNTYSYIDPYQYTFLPSCINDLTYQKYVQNKSGHYFCNGSEWIGTNDYNHIYNIPENGLSISNLSIYYNAEDNVLDYSGNLNNGSLVNTVYSSNTLKYGKSFYFDGGDYITMPIQGNLTNFSVFMYVNDLNSTRDSMLLTGKTGSSDSYFRTGSGGDFYVYYRNDSGSATSPDADNSVYIKNGIYFVGFTFSDSQICFYANGLQRGCTTHTIANPRFYANTAFQLGAYGTAGRNDDLQGYIDDFMFFKRVLTTDDVAALYYLHSDFTSNNAYYVKQTCLWESNLSCSNKKIMRGFNVTTSQLYCC